MHVVVERGRIGPVVTDGPHELRVATEWETLAGVATDELGRGRDSLALPTVTARALLRVDNQSLRRCPATGGKTGSCRVDIDVHGRQSHAIERRSEVVVGWR